MFSVSILQSLHVLRNASARNASAKLTRNSRTSNTHASLRLSATSLVWSSVAAHRERPVFLSAYGSFRCCLTLILTFQLWGRLSKYSVQIQQIQGHYSPPSLSVRPRSPHCNDSVELSVKCSLQINDGGYTRSIYRSAVKKFRKLAGDQVWVSTSVTPQ